MGVIDDFPRADYSDIYRFEPSDLEAFARFDAAFGTGREFPDEQSDPRLFGRWAQLRHGTQ